MITPQFVFMIAGIVLLVVAAVLLIISLVYYVSNDIRGVQDDLAGRKRRGRGSARSRGAVSRERANTRGVRSASNLKAADRKENIDVSAVVQLAEDEVDTVVDTKLRKVSRDMVGVNSDAYDINDDIPTVVPSKGYYHRNNMPENYLNDIDVPTVVDGSEDEVPTQVERTNATNVPHFVVTKSILVIHSSEIISVG